MVILNPDIKLLKIKNKQVDSLKIKGKVAYMHSTPYTVRTTEELEYALNNVKDGETINIKAGTYTLTKRYDIPTCTIKGAGKTDTIIKSYAFGFTSGTSIADISNIKFDGNGINRGDPGMIYLATQANINIHDCHFTNMTAQYNCMSIRIATTSSDKNIKIYNNLFDGPNSVSSYGHTNASIAGFHLSTVYNVLIYNNTFNHPSGGYTPLHNGKAIAFFNNSSAPTLNNCIAVCNTYNGSGDSNFGITEQACDKTLNVTIYYHEQAMAGGYILVVSRIIFSKPYTGSIGVHTQMGTTFEVEDAIDISGRWMAPAPQGNSDMNFSLEEIIFNGSIPSGNISGTYKPFDKVYSETTRTATLEITAS